MQTQSIRSTLVLSALFTAVVVGFVTITGDRDIDTFELLLNLVVIFVIVFTTMRLTNRVTAFMINRFAPNASRDRNSAPPPPAEPTTARPEHAQRRRSRRRQRGRRRSGE